MKLSRTITYAIQSVLYLARVESRVPVPCSQLARESRLPERFLLQILRCLVRHGLLRSTRGVEGGYSLARRADQITLLDIVEAFDNPLDPEMPDLHAMSSDVRSSILRALHDIAHVSRLELQKLSVAGLLGNDRTAPIIHGYSATH